MQHSEGFGRCHLPTNWLDNRSGEFVLQMRKSPVCIELGDVCQYAPDLLKQEGGTAFLPHLKVMGIAA